MPQNTTLTPYQQELDTVLADKRLPLTEKQRDAVWDATHLSDRADPDQLRQALVSAGVPPDKYAAGTPLATVFGLDRPQPNAFGRVLDKAVEYGTDALLGGVSGLAKTVYRGGDLIRRATGMDRVIDTPEAQAAMTPPPTLAGRLGAGAEQMAEFFVPVAGPATAMLGAPRLAKAVPAITRQLPRIRRGLEGAAAGGLTLAQGGTPTEAAVSAGLSTLIPGSSAMRQRAGEALTDSAERSMAQALGATKEVAKQEAADIAPEMLARGVGGTRRAMLDQATQQVDDLGRQIGQVVSNAATQGSTVPTADFIAAMQAARQTSQARAAFSTPIPGTEAITDTLQNLETFVAAQGAALPIDKAQALKQTWANIVSKAGLYGPSAGASPTDKASAWAYREGADSMRGLIASESPTLEKLNKEFTFWKGLQDILDATKLRTQAQGSGLTASVLAGSGATAAGAATGSLAGAVAGGAVAAALTKVVQSPIFRTRVTGPLKMALADAVSSGDQGKILRAIANINAAFPSMYERVTGAE